MAESSAGRPTGRIERLAPHHDRRTFSSGQPLPQHHIPAVHLGRLAVDESMQGQGLGGDLLFHALLTAAKISEHVGVYAVDVFAINAKAAAFYQRFGFLPLNDDPFHLFLPVKLVRQLL